MQCQSDKKARSTTTLFYCHQNACRTRTELFLGTFRPQSCRLFVLFGEIYNMSLHIHTCIFYPCKTIYTKQKEEATYDLLLLLLNYGKQNCAAHTHTFTIMRECPYTAPTTTTTTSLVTTQKQEANHQSRYTLKIIRTRKDRQVPFWFYRGFITVSTNRITP